MKDVIIEFIKLKVKKTLPFLVSLTVLASLFYGVYWLDTCLYNTIPDWIEKVIKWLFISFFAILLMIGAGCWVWESWEKAKKNVRRRKRIAREEP